MPRLLKLASFGALVHGSTGHFFYNFLDSKIPGTAALTVAKKVFIDQVLRALLYACLYVAARGLQNIVTFPYRHRTFCEVCEEFRTFQNTTV